MTCKEPFSCLNIQEDKISSCCLMATWKVNFIDFDNDTRLNEIRKTWLSGNWPDACINCKKTEDAGKISRRQSVNMWYDENNIQEGKLARIDYWTGNICNLRCAICGPENSIAWQKELGISKQTREIVTNNSWKNLDLTYLRWIHFNGGEPLLIDEHIELLKSIPNPSQVHLNYNTNGTVRPSIELIKLWEKFKLVQIDFSIDGIGKRFEYMRYPANWNQVKENLFWFRNTMPVNTMFDINATISILNQACIKDTQTWFFQNYNQNRLGDPVVFRTQDAYGCLSLNADKSAAIKYLDSLDKRRGTNWKEIFPELIDP